MREVEKEDKVKKLILSFLITFTATLVYAEENVFTEKDMQNAFMKDSLVYTENGELLTGKVIFEFETMVFKDGALIKKEFYDKKNQLIRELIFGKGLQSEEEIHYYLNGNIQTHYVKTNEKDIFGNPITEGATYYKNGNIASKTTPHKNNDGGYSLIEIFDPQGKKKMEIITGKTKSGYCYTSDKTKREATISEIDNFDKETQKIQFRINYEYAEPDFSSVCQE